MNLLTPKNALLALRIARAVPAIPLVIGAIALMGCAKVVSEARQDRPLTQLAGSEWGLQNTDQFVAFKSEGEISGNGGCNNFFGSYTQTENALAFGPLASTKKACFGDGIMQAEQAFLSSIQKARRFEATHKVMSLYDENGEVLLTLQRKDWD